MNENNEVNFKQRVPKGGEYWWIKKKSRHPYNLLKGEFYVALVEGREDDFSGEPNFVHIPQCEPHLAKYFDFIKRVDKPEV